MDKITGRSTIMTTFLTWAVPAVLLGAAAVAGRLSIELAPGEVPGRQSVYSTPLLDLAMFALIIGACVACFRWSRSALFTAAGCVAVLWDYSDREFQRALSNPLGGMVYFLTVPFAAVCVVCGLVGFLVGRQRRSRAAAAGAQPGRGAELPR